MVSYPQIIIGLSVVGVILLIPPLTWHSRTRNTPAIILIIWLLIMNIKGIVDAAVWGGANFAEKWIGYGWCDLMTKLQIGANVGLSCAVANITYNLHGILKANSVIPNANSWRKICIDLSISLLTPVLSMVLSFLVQVFRFGIFRYNGCQNMLSPTWVTLVVYTLWMLIWSLVGFIYAFLLLYVFYKKRKDVRDILHCTNSGLNVTRFSRLLIFCMLIILVMFPFSVYSFVVDLGTLGGSYRFKDIHNDATWNMILHIDLAKPMYSVWLYILMSYLVFLIFGLGSDALKMYSNFARVIGFGFVMDRYMDYMQKKKDGTIAKLSRRLFSSNETQNGVSSDGTTFVYDCYGKSDLITQTNTPTSPADFIVDYILPQDIKRQGRRKRNGDGVYDPRDNYIPNPQLQKTPNTTDDENSFSKETWHFDNTKIEDSFYSNIEKDVISSDTSKTMSMSSNVNSLTDEKEGVHMYYSFQ